MRNNILINFGIATVAIALYSLGGIGALLGTMLGLSFDLIKGYTISAVEKMGCPTFKEDRTLFSLLLIFLPGVFLSLCPQISYLSVFSSTILGLFANAAIYAIDDTPNQDS